MADSIRTIAELAGVSPATVSRVFSGKGYVRKEVAEEVLRIAAERNFQPKLYHKHNRSSSESIVGVIVPDITNTYYMDVIRGMQEVFDRHSIEMVICNSDEDPNKEIRLLSMLHSTGVDGFLAVPVSDQAMYNAQYLTELNDSGFPLVLLDRDVQGANIDGVFMDNFNSGYISTETLIKNGHREIAILCGPTTSTSGSARLRGYLAALQDHNIQPREDYILFGDFKFDTAYQLTREFLDRHTPATAIFASNSRMAQGCLYAMAEQGMSVPEDMSFIACGRLDGSYHRISTVSYPTLAIGTECANILLEKISGEKRRRGAPRKRITFDMELVLKGSEIFPVHRLQERKDA